MEQLVDEEEEIPMPLNTSLVGHNIIYHHHNHNHNPDHDQEEYNKQEEECVNVVLYKECLKNHAASSGGNAIDGCGEFMPISISDPFTCSACNCHRNFHRRLEFGPRRLVLGHHHHQMIMPYNNNHQKRFRTKFTQEQKERMVRFAEKIGWKIQKQEESVIQHFCQQIGVKRRVLKVWMHNNKHKYYITSNTIANANANANSNANV